MSMKDLKFTPGPLTVWGKNKSTVVEGFYMIEQSLSPRVPTAYVASYNDALLYAKAPEMYEALKQCKEALERTITGYEWRIENDPMSMDESDCEHLDDMKATLETLNKLGL